MSDKEKDLAIVDIIDIIWKNRILIICISLLFAIFTFIKTSFFSTPLYRADGIIYVRTISDEVAEKEDYIYGSDITAARDLTSTYAEILKTRSFLTDVSKSIGEKYSWQQIKYMLSVSSLNETELLSVVVTTPDPQDSYDIAKTILEKAPAKFESILNGGDAHIVDEAVYNDYPLSNNVMQKTIISFLFGMIISVILAFIFNFFDKKVHGGFEVSNKYNVSILGEITHTVNSKHKKGKTKNIELTGSENILNKNTPFITVETYKSIRTNIMFSIPKSDKGKVVVITSSSPGEGKTTTSINTALTFAQTGAKVILIDCDLRKSRVHRYLHIEKGDGLSNVLCGFCELDKTIKRNVRDGLDILTAGEIPSNPSELLENVEFANVLSQLQSEYDYIFIDTPPITVVTDALVVMQHCHGVVVVARDNYTTYELLDITMDNIKMSNTKIFGVVMVDAIDTSKKYSYYKYGYKYGYKYKNTDYKYGDDIQTS